MSLVEDLHSAAITITKLITKRPYSHMKGPWEMVMGGLILPAITEGKTDALSDKDKALMDKYSKEKVLEFFTTKEVEVEKVVERIVEKPVEKIVERIVEKKVVVTSTPVSKDGEVFRRIKSEVKKTSDKERDIECTDRDMIIRWWNTNQRLVPKDDPVCVKLATLINETRRLEPLSSEQVAGYFSRLCDWGRLSDETRDNIFNMQLKKGKITAPPVYSKDLCDTIHENYRKERAEDAARKEAHRRILEARKSGTSTVVTETPVSVVALEESLKALERTPEETAKLVETRVAVTEKLAEERVAVVETVKTPVEEVEELDVEIVFL